MKLHLPLSLLKSLLVAFVVGCTVESASGVVMHSDVEFQTYADFGQNLGRYVVGYKENALVRQIRENDVCARYAFRGNGFRRRRHEIFAYQFGVFR